MTEKQAAGAEAVAPAHLEKLPCRESRTSPTPCQPRAEGTFFAKFFLNGNVQSVSFAFVFKEMEKGRKLEGVIRYASFGFCKIRKSESTVPEQ